MKNIKKVLVLGSGALKIGEAGEFDYSGSQAIKALKEEGIKIILVNPNIATIQTSKFLAHDVYFLPVNAYFVEKIIAKEKPQGILLSFGGQTALNCGMDLHKSGVLKKHNVEILGTPISAIMLTEDRKKFADHLKSINVPTPKSSAANNILEAEKIAGKMKFPIMLRSGFALGGQGSGIARNVKELRVIAKRAFSFVSQILLEEYLHHYKEIEYEVVRDKFDNCITVCNMENMDPLGIHTGESIVVAPSQTLNNFEYHTLRSQAIKIARSLNIVGECNVQFALKPNPQKEIEYYVIEVNARLSRSSALASKATGYPLAYVAAKLALGKNLTDIKNKVTLKTQSCFEPALDYIVVKIPRWDIEKFKGADEQIGSSMKSVGEVMGIGRTFEEAYQKAIRMLDLDFEGATSQILLKNGKTLIESLKFPTPKRMFAIARAIKESMSIEEIYSLTGIDPWFLERIRNIVKHESEAPKDIRELTKEKLYALKRLGFSDKRIGQLTNAKGLEIRRLRKKYSILPAIFQIDTLSGEFEAKTNYLYLTYNGNHHDVKPIGKKGVIVLGSGPYRIGSSVEFDWTSVNTAMALKNHGKESIIINCNPETVSTDYDIADRLYFEELTFERIADIYDFENPYGIIISVGGQTPNNRAHALESYGSRILGTHPSSIDKAEDRSKFSRLMDTLNISQPAWEKVTSEPAAIKFCDRVGFPVLLRPSYVLSGTLMRICHNKEELIRYVEEATLVSSEYPLTISKFIEKAKEIELDAVAQKGDMKVFVISEHVENAGVHSGDASIVLPPQKVYVETKRKIEEVGRKLAAALSISGPFNIQFLAKDNIVQVIEINLRSSRTFPFISKVTGIDLAKLSVDAFFDKTISQINTPSINFAAVKAAQFSFARLTGADPILHVEMGSTGEAACFGETIEEAFLKAQIAVGERIPKKGVFISLGSEENKVHFLESARNLAALGLPLYASKNTCAFLERNGIKAKILYKIHEKKSPNVLEYFEQNKIDLAINIVDSHLIKIIGDEYVIRRCAVDHNVPLFTDLKKAELFVKAITSLKSEDLSIKSWSEYV
ncbi:MAG: carbamoyl-phosphate synthase (glutamine-hydrolyzing) large subunit [Candidatus Levybacteria bacterium]|nr:carbamoyl-phosphate synthase (glutamine-hydrolyzing) large subunit [Candidatus Levybacteria bacterium]